MGSHSDSRKIEWYERATEFARKIKHPFTLTEFRDYIREVYHKDISPVKLGRNLFYPGIRKNGNLYSVIEVEMTGKYEEKPKPLVTVPKIVSTREGPAISSWP